MKTRITLILLAAMGAAYGGSAASPPEPYTVVWNTPSADSSGSMPLGNGDIGLNVWVEEGGDLLFYIGKTDAWSENARLLKLGRIRVSFLPNPFVAGAPFRQTLDVRTGSIQIEAGAKGRRVSLRIWVDAHYPAVRIEAASRKASEMRVRFESWRTEARELGKEERFSAYGLINSPDPVVVSPDRVVDSAEAQIVWFHRNERSIWADTLRHQQLEHWIAQGRDPLLYRTFGGLIRGEGLVRSGGAELVSATPQEKHRAVVYVLSAQRPQAAGWTRQVRSLWELDSEEPHEGFAKHEEWWRAFWDRSWIRVSPAAGAPLSEARKTRAVTQGYILQRFITACAGRGAMPIKFNGSLFTVDAQVGENRFDADYRNWGGPYWFQNTRLVYWPMPASGDCDMMLPLFRMFLDALPFSIARTKTYFGHGGAFFPETMYFWGAYANDNYGWDRGDLPMGVTENRYIRYHYDGALELLALMLEYYAYTQDEAFVTGELLPLAEAVPAFFYEHYPPREDGKMRFEPSQALETWQKVIDPAPPIAGLRWVLEGLLGLPKRLTSPTQRQSWRMIAEALPPLPLEEKEGQAVLAPAAVILEEARNAENPELYAIFPYRLYGLGKPGLAVARKTFERRRIKGNKGWQQDDTQAALLGHAAEARRRLSARMLAKNPGSRFPAFWGPNFDWIPDQDHGGNGLMALQCMLLQHAGREMRLFPAWPKEWDVEFKIHAPYDTTLEGAYRGGELTALSVRPAWRRADLVIVEAQ